MINIRNYLNDNQNQIKKIILFISILFITFVSILFFIIIKFYEYNTIDKNNNDVNISIREILEEETKHDLLTNLSDISMEGNWINIESNSNGLAFIYYYTNNKLYPTQLNINFRFMYGYSIENWIIINSIIYIKDILIDKNNPNQIKFNTDYSNVVETGKMFKKENHYRSGSNIELNITKKNSSIININGLINLNNKHKNETISFNTMKSSNHKYENKIKKYTIYLSLLIILVFITNQITIKKVNNSSANAKSIYQL